MLTFKSRSIRCEVKGYGILSFIYRSLAVLVGLYGLWGMGRMLAAVNQPMGGFIWYYDEAVSGGWIVNWDTGATWAAIAPDKLQLGDRILSLDGRPPDEFGEAYRTTPIGTGITYTVLRAGQRLIIPDVPVVTFTWAKFFQSQSVFFFIGTVYWAMGAFIHYITPESDYSYAFSFFMLSTSLLTLSHAATICVTTPLRPQGLMFFFWKPIFGVAIVSCLYFATSFPISDPDLPPPLSKRVIRRMAWGMGGGLWLLYTFTGLLPSSLQYWDARAYTLNLIGFILSLLGCAAIFAHIAYTSSSTIARHQARVMLVGWGLAALPIFLMWLKLVFPGFYLPSWNVIAFLELALPLSIVYAILHYCLFTVRPYVLRILLYGLALAGFLFVYVISALIFQNLFWLEQAQEAFARLTYQPFDLRATLSTLVAVLIVLKFYLPLHAAWLMSPTSPRLPTILMHLCDRLEAQHGYIALRQEEEFVIAATHKLPLPGQILGADVALGEDEPPTIFKAPLLAEGESVPLGVIALGPKRGGMDYTPQERAFVRETVAPLLAASLHHIRRLECLAEMTLDSLEHTEDAHRQEHEVQRAFNATLHEPLRDITIDEVKAALELLRPPHADLCVLGQHPLAYSPRVEAALHRQGCITPSNYHRGAALKAVLLQEIETLRPTTPEDLNDNEWRCYLALQKTFVQGQHWQAICAELFLTRSTFYRRRDEAIERLCVSIQRDRFNAD